MTCIDSLVGYPYPYLPPSLPPLSLPYMVHTRPINSQLCRFNIKTQRPLNSARLVTLRLFLYLTGSTVCTKAKYIIIIGNVQKSNTVQNNVVNPHISDLHQRVTDGNK